MIDTRIQHCINTLIIAVQTIQLSNIDYLKQYLYEKTHKTRKWSENISILSKGVFNAIKENQSLFPI